MAKTVFLLNAQADPPPVKGGVFHLDVVTISLNKMIILPSVGKNADSQALLAISHKASGLSTKRKITDRMTPSIRISRHALQATTPLPTFSAAKEGEAPGGNQDAVAVGRQ